MNNGNFESKGNENLNEENKNKSKRGPKKGGIKNEKSKDYSRDIFDASKEYCSTIKVDESNKLEEFRSTSSEDRLIKIRESAIKELNNLSNRYSIINYDELISMAIHEFCNKYKDKLQNQ